MGKNRGYELVFNEDLPKDVFEWIESRFPRRMYFDVLGIIEQIVATWAYRFLGSSYSTFTGFILRLRKYRLILGQDTAYPRGTGLGMPSVGRNYTAPSCKPLKQL